MAAQRQRQQPLERPMEMLRLLDGGPLVLSTTSDNVSRTAATEAGCGNTSTAHDSWAAIRRMNLLRPIKIKGLEFKIGLERQHIPLQFTTYNLPLVTVTNLLAWLIHASNAFCGLDCGGKLLLRNNVSRVAEDVQAERDVPHSAIGRHCLTL